MRLLIDEDMPRSTALHMREHGHEVWDVRDIGLRGKPDPLILARAQELDAVLVTRDSGFANTMRFPLRQHAGVALLRLPNEYSVVGLNRAVAAALANLRQEEMAAAILVVEPGRVRIRTLAR